MEVEATFTTLLWSELSRLPCSVSLNSVITVAREALERWDSIRQWRSCGRVPFWLMSSSHRVWGNRVL